MEDGMVQAIRDQWVIVVALGALVALGPWLFVSRRRQR
jgi:hypothetical protein